MILRLAVAIAIAMSALYVVGKVLALRREPEPTALAPEGEGARFVATRSGRTHVLDVGDGDVVLLLHGSGRSIADWQQGFAERLAESFRVVAFDDYGFGRSDRNHPFRYGNALWEQQAVDVLDALEIERVIVMGHSSGGVVAATLAADHPERVRGAIFVGHGLAMDPVQFLPFLPGVGELMMGLTDVFSCTPSQQHCAQLRAVYRIRGTRSALLTFIRRQYTIDGLRLLTGTYEDIRVPVLQVHGSGDASISVAAARGLTRRLRESRLVVVEGVSHDVHLDAADRLADEIVAFAERVAPSRP